MEVATGEIRAIANLSRTEGGDYVEDFNYAIAEAAEPGSTFKLASLLVALEDQLVDLQDTVEVGNGVYVYSRKNGTMRDAHAPRRSRMSVQEIFEHSSNVGVSRIIFSNYAKRPQEFVNRLRSFGLGKNSACRSTAKVLPSSGTRMKKAGPAFRCPGCRSGTSA